MKSVRPSILRKSIAFSLAIAGAAQAGDQIYDDANLSNVWDLTTSNWDVSTALWAAGNNAIFAGGGETVDVNDAINVGNITFNSTGYTLADADGNGTLTLAGVPSTITVTTAGHTATISESIAAAGGVTKAGAGTLIFSGANIYAGATAVNAGTLVLLGATAMSSSSALSMSNNTTLTLLADADTTFSPASFTNFTAGSTYNISVNSTNGIATGRTLSLRAPAGGGGGTTATTLNVGGTAGAGYALKFTTTFATNSNSGSAWSTASQNVFNLTNADLVLDAGVNMGNNGNGGLTLNSTTGNTLTISGNVTTNTNRTTNAIVNSGVLTLNNTVSLGGTNQGFFVIVNGGKLNVNNAGAVRNNANIGGPGGRAGLTIAGGALDNTSGSAKTLSFNPSIGFNGDFAFSSAGGTSVNDLNLGTGATYLGAAATGTGATRAITTNGSATLTVGGVITSNGATPNNLTKEGAGTLILSGNSASTYLGATTVNAGILQVNGSISASVTTINGGKLTGNGSTGAVIVNDAGAIAAGSSIGTLSMGDLTLNDTGEFQLEMNIASASSFTTDLANATNLNLDTDSSAVLTLANLGSDTALTLGTVITFIDYSGTWNGGTFAGRADDSTFAFGVNEFRISYNGANDNDTAVVLVAVPEPGSVSLLLAGLGSMVRIRRRRASNEFSA